MNREIEAKLSALEAVARTKDGGELALALVNVMKVASGWRDGERIILLPGDAAAEVMTAIEEALQ